MLLLMFIKSIWANSLVFDVKKKTKTIKRSVIFCVFGCLNVAAKQVSIENLALGVIFENHTQFYTQKLRYHRIFRDILILLYILQTSVYKQFE